MMVSDKMPTSVLLEIKTGDQISKDSIQGTVTRIEIQETDEFLQFIFSLEGTQQIVVRKLKQVC
ncbi:MAG: hypothetical protein ABWZ79_22330 [Pedobacter agri]